MPKIVFIGAGSIKFTCRLVNDILCSSVAGAVSFALVDINPDRLEMAGTLVQEIVARHHSAAQVELTTDRRAALVGAHYVINR